MSNRTQQIAIMQAHLNNLAQAVEEADNSAETYALMQLQKACSIYDTLHRTSLIDEKKLNPNSQITVGDFSKLRSKSEELLTKERELTKKEE
jgi:hypothetical protein